VKGVSYLPALNVHSTLVQWRFNPNHYDFLAFNLHFVYVKMLAMRTRRYLTFSDIHPEVILAWILETLQTAHFPRNFLLVQNISARPSPTSWLDGLRGYAAFFVILYHLRQAYTGSVHVAYGTTENDTNPLQLPIIRLMFAGQAMVALFFVVSGYSLSWGPSKDLHKGGVVKCLERIRSSVFRRAPRLYLPTLASAFIAMLCRSLGLYEWGHKMDIRGYKAPEPERFDNFFAQLADYLSKSLEFLNVWRGNAHAYYLPSWSIPIEFKCSILLYAGLLAVSKLRLLPRMAGLAIMVLYCHWMQNAFLWLFFIGSTLAQVNCYVQRSWTDGFPPKDSRKRFCFKIFVLFLGLWLLSFPDSSCMIFIIDTEAMILLTQHLTL
jgi:peptidoglycan/LPS O-acetylase OafA/YrhL